MRRLPVAGSLAVFLGLSLWGSVQARAEGAWVRGEVRLNVRSGPSTDYRILGVVSTGDAVTILERGESWTQIQTLEGKQGWIPAGYLDPEPPPTVQLANLESEVETLRKQLSETQALATRLRSENEALAGQDEQQKQSIRELTEENLDLKAGARWPYLITGASILTIGMVAGAILGRTSGRRRSRIRL